jgi:hypothetical protein
MHGAARSLRLGRRAHECMPRSACIQTRTQRDEAVLGEFLRMTEPDIVDAVAGLAPASPIATLRRQREAFVLHT